MNGKYFTDYLIVGKNSGGYEFVFVELEAQNKSTTVKIGYEGLTTRSDLNKVSEWKSEIEANFKSIRSEFEKCLDANKLTLEFKEYESTRMHYMVITALCSDYNIVTYRTRRLRAKENGIEIYYYDNLIDFLNN